MAAALASVASPLAAHHSFAAEYRSELKTWTGTITRFAWTNPHTRVYFDGSEAGGGVRKVDCEGSAPGGLVRGGWTRDTLKPGDKVVIEGYPAKERPGGCKVRAVILPGGRRMTMGAEGGQPVK
jgi:hypothetical protein